MRCIHACLLVSVVLFWPIRAPAEIFDQPFAEVFINPDSVTVGEALELQVSVYVPTWFTQPPTFPTFELTNAVTHLPPDSAYPVSKQISGATWSGITRHYKIYPLVSAEYRFSGLTIKVSYANPGSPPEHADLPLDELVFTAVVPKGAENLEPYLAGTDLTFQRTIEGDSQHLVPGDAIVLVYRATLTGLPAMFLPELAPDNFGRGIKAYPGAAEVKDGAIAERIERVTLVFEEPGQFEIPADKLSWWSNSEREIRTTVVPSISIVVAVVSPQMPDEPELLSPSARGWYFWMICLGIILLLGWLLARLLHRLKEALVTWRQGEAYAYGQLRRCLRQGDAQGSYHALCFWLGRFAPGLGPRQFAAKCADEQLSQHIERLSASAFNNPSTTSWADLRPGLDKARKHYRDCQAETVGTDLPPLNPQA